MPIPLYFSNLFHAGLSLETGISNFTQDRSTIPPLNMGKFRKILQNVYKSHQHKLL